MSVIQKLPETTIQLIAAGEVITRPVNIVKELLENSLDAGSTNIRIAIEQGGLNLIEIIDNGDGIARANAKVLCNRYTTSKLHTADDLNRISTFGFRGEALASISEMADLEVRTFCMRSDNMGWTAHYKAGELVELPVDKYLQHAGTHLRITKLFSTTPMRRKALQSSFIDEKKAIIDLVTRYAIHHRDKVTMSLKEGNNDLLCLLAPMKIGPTLGMFFGIEMENNLMEFALTNDYHFKMQSDITISYKKSSASSGNFNFILFVNDRLVDCNDLKKEFEVSIHNFLSMKMYNLLAIVNLHVPPNDVDVNMHPAKATVALHYHVEIVALMVERVRAELKEKLNFNTIAPSTPMHEKSVSQLLSQTNSKRLSVLAPACVPKQSPTIPAAKRSYDLVHNDSSQRSLAQLSGSRRYSEVIAPWPTNQSDSMPRKSLKVTIKAPPSPDVETVVYQSDNKITPNILPPQRKRRDLKLRSIHELRKLVAKERAVDSAHTIKNSVFVGLFDHDRCLIQHETRLYAINLKAYLKEQYYQFYLFDIGNFPPIEILPPGNKVRFIIDTTLEDARRHDQKYFASLKHKDTHSVIEELLKHAAMYEDYLSLKITRNEILTIPCVMPDEVPNLTFLGKFLIDLANMVDYTNEKECLRTIGRLVGNFYSEPPANLKSKDVHRHYHNLIQTKLYEAIKRYLIIPEWLLTKENICQISDTKDLYKVFERC